MPITDLIPTVEVAAQLGVDVRTVARLVQSGQLTYVVKAPGKRGAYMFDPADVDRYQASLQVAS